MPETDTSSSQTRGAEKLPSQRFQTARNVFVAGFEDFFSGMARVRVWRELAWEDFIKRYRRSYFGVLWAILSFAVVGISILFFFSAVTGEGMQDGVSYIILGFLAFQLLSNIILDGCNVFTQAAGWITSARLPLSLFVFRDVARILIVFFFNAVGAAIILVWHGYVLPPGFAWSLVGLAVTIFNAFWVYLLLGVLVARFKDLFHLIGAIMRLGFFISPIMWVPTGEGMRSLIALYNPLTHYIAIMRDPLLGVPTPWMSWQIVGAVTLIGWASGIFMFCLLRRRVIYWV